MERKSLRKVILYMILIITTIYTVPREIHDYNIRRLMTVLGDIKFAERANIIDQDLNKFEVSGDNLDKFRSSFGSVVILDKMKKEVNPYIENKILDIEFNIENDDWVTIEVWKLSHDIEMSCNLAYFTYFEENTMKHTKVLFKVNNHYISNNTDLDEITDITI